MLTSLARAKTAAQSARLGWLITAVRRPTRPQGWVGGERFLGGRVGGLDERSLHHA